MRKRDTPPWAAAAERTSRRTSSAIRQELRRRARAERELIADREAAAASHQGPRLKLEYAPDASRKPVLVRMREDLWTWVRETAKKKRRSAAYELELMIEAARDAEGA